MTTASVLRRASDALSTRLDDEERVLAAAFAWVATPRPRVPLLFLARHPHWLALTDRRVVLLRRPRHRRPPDTADVVLDAPLGAVDVQRARGLHPLMQLRVAAPDVSTLVVELRPRDRRVGRRLLGQPGEPRDPGEPGEPDTAGEPGEPDTARESGEPGER